MKRILYQILKKDMVKRLSQKHGDQFIHDVLSDFGLNSNIELCRAVNECYQPVDKLDTSNPPTKEVVVEKEKYYLIKSFLSPNCACVRKCIYVTDNGLWGLFLYGKQFEYIPDMNIISEVDITAFEAIESLEDNYNQLT